MRLVYYCLPLPPPAPPPLPLAVPPPPLLAAPASLAFLVWWGGSLAAAAAVSFAHSSLWLFQWAFWQSTPQYLTLRQEAQMCVVSTCRQLGAQQLKRGLEEASGEGWVVPAIP